MYLVSSAKIYVDVIYKMINNSNAYLSKHIMQVSVQHKLNENY